MSVIAQSLSDEGGGRRGESNTPFSGEIANEDRRSVYKVAGVGVDQVRVVLSLSGDAARLCSSLTEHDYRPKGMPSMRMVGAWAQDGFKRVFRHFLGEDGPRLLYHRESANLHVDIHFDELVAVGAAVRKVEAVVARLGRLGIDSLFPVRVARADFTGDVVFASAAYFRHVFSAFRAMLCERGRVVEPYRSSTLYVYASRAARTKRLGRSMTRGLSVLPRPVGRYRRSGGSASRPSACGRQIGRSCASLRLTWRARRTATVSARSDGDASY